MHFQLLSRAIALDINSKFYFTGEPCANGRLWVRRTSNRACQCRECTDKRSEVREKWRLENLCVVAKSRREWGARNKEKVRATNKKCRDKDIDLARAKQRERYCASREAMRVHVDSDGGTDFYAQLLDRDTAKSKGIMHHFTGTKCIRGNVALRYTPNGSCMCEPCVAAKRESARASEKRNWDKKLQRAVRYRDKNRIEIRKRMSGYAASNAGKITAYREKNRVRIADNARKYREENRDVFRVYVSNRTAARIQRTPKWFGELDEFVVKESAHLCILRESVTGVVWHTDHCIPLRAKQASGLHCAHNLQVIPGYVNNHKKNRMMATEPYEWCRFI